MASRLEQIKRLARVVFAREELGSAPPPGAEVARPPGFLAQLFMREELPLEPELPREERPGLATRMFGSESLPEEPPAPPRRPLPLLRWWLRPERLDEDG